MVNSDKSMTRVGLVRQYNYGSAISQNILSGLVGYCAVDLDILLGLGCVVAKEKVQL